MFTISRKNAGQKKTSIFIPFDPLGNEDFDCKSGNQNIINPINESFDLVPSEEYSVSEITNNNATKNENFQPSDPELASLAAKLSVEFDSRENNSNINVVIEDDYSELVIGNSQVADSAMFDYKHQVTTVESDTEK